MLPIFLRRFVCNSRPGRPRTARLVEKDPHEFNRLCQFDNLIAQILKNEDYFPTTVSRGKSESIVRFPKEGRLEVLK
jgi:hypothetical protein